MGVVDMLKAQRKEVEAKIAELREELADIDIALRAIEARKASQRPVQSGGSSGSGLTPMAVGSTGEGESKGMGGPFTSQ